MLKTTQRDPIVGISVYQLWGLKLFLSDTRGPPLSVMSHHHWQGWWVSKKLKRPWKELMALSTVSDFVLILTICVCSLLEPDDAWWVKWDPVRMNGTASHSASPSGVTAFSCLSDSCLPRGQRRAAGRGGGQAWKKGQRTKRGQGRSRGVTGSQREELLINELFFHILPLLFDWKRLLVWVRQEVPFSMEHESILSPLNTSTFSVFQTTPLSSCSGLYTNSPRSSKGRSESFCGCPTSVGSLTLPVTCWERRLHLSCRRIASALSTLYFLTAAMSVKQASNQRALNWQLFLCTNLRACWWSPTAPLIWDCVVKQGRREGQKGRQDVLVHAVVSHLFVHVAVRVRGRLGEIWGRKGYNLCGRDWLTTLGSFMMHK